MPKIKIRRAIGAVRKALAAQHAQDHRRLVGRWRLPSGAVLRVVRINDETGLALCGDGRQRFHVHVADLVAVVDSGQATYVGR